MRLTAAIAFAMVVYFVLVADVVTMASQRAIDEIWAPIVEATRQ